MPTLPAVPTLAPLAGTTPVPRLGNDPPVGGMPPVAIDTCPNAYPIKAVISATDRRHYTPLHIAYRAARPTRCYASVAEAEAAGYPAAPR